LVRSSALETPILRWKALESRFARHDDCCELFRWSPRTDITRPLDARLNRSTNSVKSNLRYRIQRSNSAGSCDLEQISGNVDRSEPADMLVHSGAIVHRLRSRNLIAPRRQSSSIRTQNVEFQFSDGNSGSAWFRQSACFLIKEKFLRVAGNRASRNPQIDNTEGRAKSGDGNVSEARYCHS